MDDVSGSYMCIFIPAKSVCTNPFPPFCANVLPQFLGKELLWKYEPKSLALQNSSSETYPSELEITPLGSANPNGADTPIVLLFRDAVIQEYCLSDFGI